MRVLRLIHLLSPRDRERDERGAVAVMVTIFCLVLFVMCAFVVDFGQAYFNKRQDQSAVDAGALAAGTVYQKQHKTCDVLKLDSTKWLATKGEAETQAKSLLDQNLGGTNPNPVFSVECGTTNPKAFVIHFAADKDSHIGLGQLATDADHVTVGREAEVTVVITETAIPGTPAIPGSPAIPGALVGGCSLCFMGSVDTANADYTVTGGGDVYFNGSASTGSTGHVTANKVTVVGTHSGNFSPAVVSGPVFVDPYASMIQPLPFAGLTAKTDPCGTGPTHGPGTYGNVDLPNGACTLQPGAYYITGKWLAKNNTNLSGTGVTLYFKSPNGELDMKNGDISNLVAPTASPLTGWPSGFAIIYDRTNTHNIGLQGNGNTQITGGVYAVGATLDFNGNSCFGFNLGPVVVKSGTGNGTKGCVNLTNAHNVGGVPGPGTPAVPDTPGTPGKDGVDGSLSLTK